ncbi:glycoside hydrolase family 38 C-terminal domain-containing protein [Sinomonas sp. JGH33]|uniref:Glycoside hydrolase family 38 C-terminal domain-containing protein n=1 Tax=Sinomonas terricola TaxID=3110330 RepID=A0ABU5T3C3_9MICC|nr:glycoside hydrolase family 38 C-terminal domain-containing protein [Sinomonas sp. JGH33]MEA5454164.1 glycoside hydrolase family 38 C-terminal domain-containing protein [Sinomonas sp. JGH33]
MHDDRLITEARIDRFVRDRLEPAVYRRTTPLVVERWDVPGEPVPVTEALAQEYARASEGEAWGPAWGTTWLRLSGEVPEGWGEDGFAVEAVIDLGFTGQLPGFQCEGQAWTADGIPLKAVNPRNRYIPLGALGGGPAVVFYVEAAANPDMTQGWQFIPTRQGDPATASREPLYRLGRIVLAERNVEAWELLQDVLSLRGLMHELPMDRPRRYDILRALERLCDVVDPDDVPGTIAAGREAVKAALAAPANASALRLVATGHAHIDSAWLWPVRETMRKCARTFSNVVSLMDDDPELTFSCSSAQQLAWIQAGYPELFERIKEKVAEGRFVPVGGMWVEADGNMPGGEAMARQFVEGKRFFLEELGVECEECWLPDSFGYSAALPQIVRAAGERYFLTQKTSWNQTNRIPHHSFLWEGLDGSRVFTHFPPGDTYNSELTAAELAYTEKNFRDKGRSSIGLVPFGYGDGGGGPTREMLAAARRARDLEGSPRVELGVPREFFAAAAAEYADPPVWAGEMYLEKHRGTYTSQAGTKRGNRRCEHLLREAELWCATATVREGVPYPAEELKRIWRVVLLQQFHDILPGSSIAWVHRDAERNYAAVERELEEIIGRAAGAVAGQGDVELVLNAAPHARAGVPALGVGAVVRPARPTTRAELRNADDGAAHHWVLGNGLVRAEIDARGLLVSLRDAASGREAIAPGAAGNLLELHRDTPNEWDSWDLDPFYRRNVTQLTDVVSVEAVAAPGGAAAVEVRRSFGASTVTQRLVLAPGAESLRIETAVDWHEREKLLKLGFPLDVRAERAASEIQFGHVFRPIATNTSWDWARFETCAHRWVHVGEGSYGVAVTNSSTYGHDVTRAVRADGGTTTTLRLSLLKAPLYPDPETDQGRHEFVVTVRPRASIADAVEEGYRTNLEPRIVRGARASEPLVVVNHPAAVVEAVKLAEDGSGDVIVRLYESLGERVSVAVSPRFAAAGVESVDLLERPFASEDASVGAEIELGAGGTALMVLRPFQLVTLRFRRER